VSVGDLRIVTTRVNRDRGYRYFEDAQPIRLTVLADLPEEQLPGAVFRHCRSEYGRCSGKVYVDTTSRGTIQTGWTFEKRERYEDDDDTYLCETWVTLDRITRERTPSAPGEVQSLDLGGRP
jgi:hypothetical protein